MTSIQQSRTGTAFEMPAPLAAPPPTARTAGSTAASTAASRADARYAEASNAIPANAPRTNEPGPGTLVAQAAGAAEGMAGGAAARRYGEADVIQIFTSAKWRGREFILYQVQNLQTGDWEVRLNAGAGSAPRLTPDMLAFTSDRAVRVSDFGTQGDLWRSVERTAGELGSLANTRDQIRPGRADGNAWDFLVGGVVGSTADLIGMVGGIPEDAVRATGGVVGGGLALLEEGADQLVRLVNPDFDGSRTGLNNPIRVEGIGRFVGNPNVFREGVSIVERELTEFLRVDRNSRQYALGEVLVPLLVTRAGSSSNAPRLPVGNTARLPGNFSADDVAAMARRAPPNEIVGALQRVPDDALRAGLSRNPGVADGLRSGLRRYPTDTTAQQALARIDRVTAPVARTAGPGSARPIDAGGSVATTTMARPPSTTTTATANVAPLRPEVAGVNVPGAAAARPPETPVTSDPPWIATGETAGTYLLRTLGYPNGVPAAAPAAPANGTAPAPRYPSVNEQIEFFNANLPADTAQALKPYMEMALEGLSPAQAYATIARTINEPGLFEDFYNQIAPDYAARIVAPGLGAPRVEMRFARIDEAQAVAKKVSDYNGIAETSGSDHAAYAAVVNTPLGPAIIQMTGRLPDLADLLASPFTRGAAPRIDIGTELDAVGGMNAGTIDLRAREWAAFEFARDAVGPGLPIAGVTFQPIAPGMRDIQLADAHRFNTEADMIRRLPDRTTDEVAFPVAVRTPGDGPSGGLPATAVLYGPAETVAKLITRDNPGARLTPYEEGMLAAGRTTEGVAQIAQAARAANTPSPTASDTSTTGSGDGAGTLDPDRASGQAVQRGDTDLADGTAGGVTGGGSGVPPGNRPTATGAPDDDAGRIVPAVADGTGGGDASDALIANRRHNMGVTRDGEYRLAVPIADGSGVRQYENLTAERAGEIAARAAEDWNAVAGAGRRPLDVDDIVANANGIVPDRDGMRLNRQSEIVVGDPASVQIGPPRSTWPSGNVPDAMRLDPARIDRVIDALKAQGGGFREGLADPLIRPQLEAIARGDLNGALYELNPRFFEQKQTDGLANRPSNPDRDPPVPPGMRELARDGALGRLFTEFGVRHVDGPHRFGQMRQASGEPFPDNTTVIATRQSREAGIEIDGPYRTILDNLRANAPSYDVVELVPGRGGSPDAWRPVEFRNPAERLQSVLDVIEGNDTARMISLRGGPENQWRYGWAPMTRQADLDLRGVDGWQPPLRAEALMGIPPPITSARTTDSLQLVQDLIDFSARYPNGAAENAVTALMIANGRALPMVTDRSQASNTIMNAVVTAASREVVLGNAAPPEGGFFDLNLPPLTMPAERALTLQLDRTPVVDATTGATYDGAAKSDALRRVMDDMREAAPDLYERVFGPPGGPGGPSGPSSRGPTDGGPDSRLRRTEAEIFGSSSPSGTVSEAMRAAASERLARYGLDLDALSPRASPDGAPRDGADFAGSVASIDLLARALAGSELGLGADALGSMLAGSAGSSGAAARDLAVGDGLLEGLLDGSADPAVPRSHLEWYARADGWLTRQHGVGVAEVVPPFRYTGVEGMIDRLDSFARIAERVPQVTRWGPPPPATLDLEDALPADPELRARVEDVLGDLADIDEGPVTLDLLVTADLALRARGSAGIDVLVDLSRRPLASELAQRIVGSAPVAIQSRGEWMVETIAREQTFVTDRGMTFQLAVPPLDPGAISAGMLATRTAGRNLDPVETAVLQAVMELGEANTAEIRERIPLVEGQYSDQLRAINLDNILTSLNMLTDARILRRFGNGISITYAVASNAADVPDLSLSQRGLVAAIAEGRQSWPLRNSELGRVLDRDSSRLGETLSVLEDMGIVRMVRGGVEGTFEPAAGPPDPSSVVRGTQSLSSDHRVEHYYAGPRIALDANDVSMIRALHRGGEMTRSELAETLGLNRSGTVFERTLAGLLDGGVVVEMGDREVGSGTPTIALAAAARGIDAALTRGHRMVLDVVLASEGIDTRSVARALASEMSRPTVTGYLRDLVDHGAVARDENGIHHGPDARPVAPAREFVPDALDRTLLGAVERGEATARELADATGEEVHFVGSRMRRLTEEGLVQRLGRDMSISYALAGVRVDAPDMTRNERAIVALVRDRGAMPGAEIGRALDLTERQTERSFGSLVEAGELVRHGPARGPHVYAPPGVEPSSARVRDAADRSLIERLGEGEATSSELAEAVGLSTTAVRDRIARLIEEGAVQQLGQASATSYALANAPIANPHYSRAQRAALEAVSNGRSVTVADVAAAIGYDRTGAGDILRQLVDLNEIARHEGSRGFFFTLPDAPALSPPELSILDALSDDPLTTAQLHERTGMAAATVRGLASALEDAGLVESYRDGRKIYYRTVQ